MKHELRLFFIALQFFTRIPVPRWVGYSPAWLNASARHFPAVGLFVGVLAAGVYVAASLRFPAIVSAWLCVAFTTLLTGAFHEDGLADTCDGLGGAVSRARALDIMKDSRLGTYGAVGLLIVLALKTHALAGLPPLWAAPAIVLSHTLSRSLAVVLIRSLPYAGDVDKAKAKPLATQLEGAGVVVALLWSSVVVLAILWIKPNFWEACTASALAASATTLWCHRWFRRRVGGFTGDLLGATQQLSELTIVLAWLAVRGPGPY